MQRSISCFVNVYMRILNAHAILCRAWSFGLVWYAFFASPLRRSKVPCCCRAHTSLWMMYTILSSVTFKHLLHMTRQLFSPIYPLALMTYNFHCCLSGIFSILAMPVCHERLSTMMSSRSSMSSRLQVGIPNAGTAFMQIQLRPSWSGSTLKTYPQHGVNMRRPDTIL